MDLSNVVLFSHGTTVATNALITRRLPRTAMVCTKGFRDVIEIRRANKDDIWDIYKDVAPPYVPRRDRLTVAERVDAAGKVVTPLDEEGAREVARILKKRGVAAVAVCFMNAYANGANEQRMKAILAGGAARRPGLDFLGDPARDLRARTLLHHGGQRRPQPGRGRLHHEARRSAGGSRLQKRPSVAAHAAAA